MSVRKHSKRKGEMENSKDDFQKGFSYCCNEIVQILDEIPDGATKQYILHYLLSELNARYYLLTKKDDIT